jgi:hypothetical protein
MFDAGIRYELVEIDDDDGDDECRVTAACGPDVLIDYPHAREHCGKNAFGTAEFCNNCFCMVCNVVAADCKAWASHHLAKFNDPKWRKLRDERIAAEKAALEAGKLSTEALKVRVTQSPPPPPSIHPTHTHTHTYSHTHTHTRARAVSFLWQRCVVLAIL